MKNTFVWMMMSWAWISNVQASHDFSCESVQRVNGWGAPKQVSIFINWWSGKIDRIDSGTIRNDIRTIEPAENNPFTRNAATQYEIFPGAIQESMKMKFTRFNRSYRTWFEISDSILNGGDRGLIYYYSESNFILEKEIHAFYMDCKKIK